MAINSKNLVIDASLARAAGPQNSPHPLARQCRHFLDTVLLVCHRIVFTTGIKEEWTKHQSSHARAWLVAMRSRRKVIFKDIPTNHKLCQLLKANSSSDLASREIMKDSHLLEAALEFDKIVISLDETVRRYCATIAVTEDILKRIIWENPGSSADALSSWLKMGAPRTSNNTLVAFAAQCTMDTQKHPSTGKRTKRSSNK